MFDRGEEWERPDGGLQRFLDDATRDAAGRRRSRRRLLSALAAEEATFVGKLRDLVERGAPATVTTVAGRTVRGRLSAVGRDVVVVAAGSERGPGPDGGGRHLVALDAITGVRPVGSRRPAGPGPSGAAAGGARGPTHDLSLREILAGICAEEPDVVVYGRTGPAGQPGRLVGVGVDVLMLTSSGADRAPLLVPSGAVSEVLV